MPLGKKYQVAINNNNNNNMATLSWQAISTFIVQADILEIKLDDSLDNF